MESLCVGGGLRRSQLLESNVAVMGDYDERILGGGDLVASLREKPRPGGKPSRTIGSELSASKRSGG